MDLGYTRGRFNWQNTLDRQNFIRERLDRAVASIDWLNLNPKVVLKYLNMEYSDRKPILVCTNGDTGEFFKPSKVFKA